MIRLIGHLQLLNTALKILGWVTLTCQFDSGPRHQRLVNQGFQAKNSEFSLCLEKRQTEPFGAYTDTKRHKNILTTTTKQLGGGNEVV